MWLRVDARRATTAAYCERLRGAGIAAARSPACRLRWCSNKPCDVHELPGFAEGAVSVQDLGAQCVAFPLELGAGLSASSTPARHRAARPRSSRNASRILSGSLAVDIDPKRLKRVRENLERGQLRAELVPADAAEPAAWWDGEPFDRILLDAPCSALG